MIKPFKKKNPKPKQRKIAEVWITEKGNPRLRNLGYATHEELMVILMGLRDILFAETVTQKFLDQQNATIIDPKTGMPTTSERKN